MSKTPIIVVDSGELYLLGKLISRHHEFPWLFSITDVHKACEKSIKREAVRKGKSPETYFKSREPGQWLRTKNEEGIKRSALSTRKRLIKHGISCGFDARSIDMRRRISIDVYSISDRDTVIKVVKGGSTKGANKITQGTYVCQNWIIQYAAFLNEPLSEEITNTFISVLNGYTEEVVTKVQKNERTAKGTQARIDNIELNNKLVEACGRKSVLPMKVQEGINEGALGMTATKYKKAYNIKEPFNDNVLEIQVATKNIGIILATTKLNMHVKPKLNQREGKQIGKISGELAKATMHNALKNN